MANPPFLASTARLRGVPVEKVRATASVASSRAITPSSLIWKTSPCAATDVSPSRPPLSEVDRTVGGPGAGPGLADVWAASLPVCAQDEIVWSPTPGVATRTRSRHSRRLRCTLYVLSLDDRSAGSVPSRKRDTVHLSPCIQHSQKGTDVPCQERNADPHPRIGAHIRKAPSVGNGGKASGTSERASDLRASPLSEGDRRLRGMYIRRQRKAQGARTGCGTGVRCGERGERTQRSAVGTGNT